MIAFISKFRHWLGFGVLASMFSGPGQTFLISLFIPHMRDYFGLSQTGISAWYSGATLAAGCILPLLGRALDRHSTIKITLISACMVSLGCILLGLSQSIIVVAIGFFLIRLFGQGGLGLISSTTMARKFNVLRGKALGIANMGYPFAEAVFPASIIMVINQTDWRVGWFTLASLLLLVFAPLVIYLLRHAAAVNESSFIGENDLHNVKGPVEGWTLKQVFGDWRFYLLMLPIYIPPVFVTGLFFHQASLISLKGWDTQMIAKGFIVFAVCRSPVSFIVGPFIDKYSGKKLFPLSLIPIAIGLFCFLLGNNGFWLYPYMAFVGISVGFGMTTASAMWAEMYGTKHLGSIKGVTSALMVLSTAIAPIVLGMVLDANVSITTITWSMILINVMGIILATIACREKNQKPVTVGRG